MSDPRIPEPSMEKYILLVPGTLVASPRPLPREIEARASQSEQLVSMQEVRDSRPSWAKLDP